MKETKTTESAPAPKMKTIYSGYRWELLVLLFFAYFFHQSDRAIYGVVSTPIQDYLHIQDLNYTRTITYALMAIFVPLAGFVGDRFNKRRLLIGCLFFWSIATIGTGSIESVYGLIFINSIALVVAEAFYGPASTSLIASYHKETRSVALSVHQTAVYLSVIFCGGVAGWIAQHGGNFAIKLAGGYNALVSSIGLNTISFNNIASWDSENCGWRLAYWAFGGVSLIIGALLILRLKDPTKVRFADSSVVETVKSSEKEGVWQAIKGIAKAFFTTPSALLLTVGFTAIVFVNNAYVIVVPSFLGDKFHLNLTQAGWNGMFWHNIAAFGCIYLGGFLSDHMSKKRPTYRPIQQFVAMLIGAPIVCAIGYANNLTTVYALFFLMGACRGFFECNTHASVFETIPIKYRSATVALMLFFAFFIGSPSAQFFSALYHKYNAQGKPDFGYQLGYVMLGIAWFIGAICVGIAAFGTFEKDRAKRIAAESAAALDNPQLTIAKGTQS
ncbi:MAG: MFS transporter [Thermoguttaceae bacterium]|nr:MFS transporter [Thermoguttaceae bacterium]